MSKRKRDISRRQFLEGTGAVFAVATAGPALKVDLPAANPPVTDELHPACPLRRFDSWLMAPSIDWTWKIVGLSPNCYATISA